MFTPAKQMQAFCSIPCTLNHIEAGKAKKAEEAKKEENRRTKAQKEAIKTIPQLKKEAQHEFNRFIRARDRLSGASCICCGEPLRWDIPGGSVDAGHWRSTGAADHLRFNEDNCHAQRAICNRHGAGRVLEYRRGLIAKIGRKRVRALMENNATVKWTRDGLRAIRDEYRAKAKELEKQ